MQIEVSDSELAHIKIALRLRVHQMEVVIKHIRGEYTDEHKRHLDEVRKLYYKLGGST
jgi:hypothetical protein